MNQTYDFIVVGAGAAGMAASISAAEKQERVLLIEKGDRCGRKIQASGNGRCNMLNTSTPKYFGDTAFSVKVVNNMPPEEIIRFFGRYGLMTLREEDGRVYPRTLQSSTVIKVLKSAMEINHVQVETGTTVTSIEKKENLFLVSTDDGRKIFGRRVLICTGGIAQPKLGGSADGYTLLSRFGHRMIPVFPSLVPVKTDVKSISGLAGIRVRCSVSILKDEETLHRESGELLFTDYGISGICVMQCSRFLQGYGCRFEINFLEDIFEEEEEAMAEMRRRREVFADFSPVMMLEGIVHSRISYAIMKQAGIALKGEKAIEISDKELRSIVRTARQYSIQAEETIGMDYAQVTAGGISCDDFCPETMESRLVDGLYAAGEVLNVDGDCGGFNLMFAFSSGLIAGMAGRQGA